MNLKITVLVNDEALEGLMKVHGLSIFIEYMDQYILFDVGPSPKILEYNSDKIGIDLELVDKAVLSHIHISHIGGLPLLEWSAPFIKVYVPYGSIESIRSRVKVSGLKLLEVDSWTEIYRGVYITKPIHGPPWEHSLVIDTDKGLAVFTGCMHPGIRKVVEEIWRYLGEKRIYALIGGFHLSNAPEQVIDDFINYLEVLKPRYIAPLHCSGSLLKEKIKSSKPGIIYDLKAGESLQIM